MNTLLAILAAVGGVFAWIYSLIQKNASLKNQLAQNVAKDEIKELADKVTAQEGKVTEDERDYSNLKDIFNRNNSDSGNK